MEQLINVNDSTVPRYPTILHELDHNSFIKAMNANKASPTAGDLSFPFEMFGQF